jgi:hypothetical protein
MGEPRTFGDAIEYLCHNCGVFRYRVLRLQSSGNAGYLPMERAKLSYGLRRMGGNALLSSYLLESLIQDTKLPDASALQDNLLLYMQSELAGPGEATELWAPAMRGWLGALSSAGSRWGIDQALAAELVEGTAVRPRRRR